MEKKPVGQSLNVFCETLSEGPDLKPKRSDRGGDKQTNGVTNKYGNPPVFNRSPSLGC